MEAQPLRRSWSGFRTLLSALELPSAAQDGQLMPFKHIASPEGRRHDEEGVGKRSGREQKAQKNWSSLGSLRPFRNWCSFASSFRFYHKSHNIWSFSWVTFSQPALKENFHHHLQRWKLTFKEKHKNINPRNINAKKKMQFRNKLCEISCGHFLHLSCGSGLISHSELSLLHRSFKIPLSPCGHGRKEGLRKSQLRVWPASWAWSNQGKYCSEWTALKCLCLFMMSVEECFT